jgi:RES domain
VGEVYRAVRLGYWLGVDPLPRRRSVLRDGLGNYPGGRWNRPDQDALYASFDPEVAFEEQAQHFRPGSAAASWLGAHGAGQEIVVVRFEEPPTPPWTFDGRRRPEPAFWSPYMHRRTPGADPSVVYEVTRLCGAVAVKRGACRLVVPSAVRYTSAGPLWWNSVWFVGGAGQVQQDDLPAKRDLRFILQRRA